MTLCLIGIAVLLVFAFLGFPLGFVMVAVGTSGFALLRGGTAALEMAGQIVLDIAMSNEYSSLPLFVLMGVFIHRSKISEDLYAAAHAWLGHFRGGLAMATVLACGGLAAVTGSSLATTATMARVAMPSMRKYGYANSLAAGSIASGGTLGMLLPPSTSLLIYGILTNQNIGKLFIAGIVPGMLLIGLFMIAIAFVTRLYPSMAPTAPRVGWRQRSTSTGRVWPVMVLFGIILAGIYLGIFTASESGGIGSVGALAFAVYRKRLTLRSFFDALVEAARTTTMLFSVGFGALLINNFVVVGGMPGALVDLIQAANLTPLLVLLALVVIYLLLGMVFDGIALVLLTVPLFFPMVVALGFDLIWFGIFVTVLAEISVISPPVGLNVFVMRAIYPELHLWEVFNGIWPFFFAALVLLAIIVAFPLTVVWLPSLMK